LYCNSKLLATFPNRTLHLHVITQSLLHLSHSPACLYVCLSACLSVGVAVCHLPMIVAPASNEFSSSSLTAVAKSTTTWLQQIRCTLFLSIALIDATESAFCCSGCSGCCCWCCCDWSSCGSVAQVDMALLLLMLMCWMRKVRLECWIRKVRPECWIRKVRPNP
jgi:hypothetical protein